MILLGPGLRMGRLASPTRRISPDSTGWGGFGGVFRRTPLFQWSRKVGWFGARNGQVGVLGAVSGPRAPTGVGGASGGALGGLAEVSARMRERATGPVRLLVAKPGLDGHSNGAEQIAVAARDAGMEVIYSGIRLTLDQIVASARDEDPDVIGLSILSGSHLELVPDLIGKLRAEGIETPVVVGGIIPEDDRPKLLAAGVTRVYTPKDFELGTIMSDIADIADIAG